MVKDVFLYNGSQRNTFACVLRSNRSMFFNLLKGLDPSYPVLKFDNNLSSRNRDMAQSVILYSCDLETSRSTVRSIKFCTAMRTLPMSIHVKFRLNLIASCLDTVNKSLTEKWAGEERKKERTRSLFTACSFTPFLKRFLKRFVYLSVCVCFIKCNKRKLKL